MAIREEITIVLLSSGYRYFVFSSYNLVKIPLVMCSSSTKRQATFVMF